MFKKESSSILYTARPVSSAILYTSGILYTASFGV